MGRARIFTNEEKEKILKDYSEGKSLAELMREYHCGREVLIRFLDENGIQRRNTHNRNIALIPEENKQKVIDNYLFKKQGLQTAGKEFGYNQGMVESILKEAGIKKRTYTESKQEGRKYSCNDNFFKEQNSNMAYVLGFIAADGSIAKKENAIHINLSAIDGEILERIKTVTESTRPVKYYTKNTTGQELVKFSVWSHEWKKDLEIYGITPAKTFTLQPPTFLNKKYCKDYIRGYFDADGSVWPKKMENGTYIPNVKICGASKDMMQWIRDILANEYGIVCNLVKYNIPNGTVMYDINITSYEKLNRFYDLLYKDNPELYLLRKKEKFDSLIKNIPRDSNTSD